MNPLSKMIEQKRQALEAGPKLSQDSYDRWLDNECTKRLFAEIELDILDAHLDINEANAKEYNAAIDSLTEVLNWKPAELDTNE